MTSGAYSRSPCSASRDLLADRRRRSRETTAAGTSRPRAARWSRSDSACVCLPLWSSPSKAMSMPGHQRHRLSSASMSSIVCRRRIDAPARRPVDHDFGGQRPAVVVRRHHRAVGAGVEDREQVADLRRAAAAGPGRACRCSRTPARRCPQRRPAPAAVATGSMRWKAL